MGILSRLFGNGNQHAGQSQSQGDDGQGQGDKGPYCAGCQSYIGWENFIDHNCLPDYDYSQPVCYRCGSHNINQDKGKCLDCGGKRLMQS